MSGRLVGFGYQGRTVADLVSQMRACGATLLVDVRLTPVSRVRGFSRRSLCSALAEEGLRYEHRPELGNPRDNRPGYAAPGTPAADRAHRRFREDVLTTRLAQDALSYLADLVKGGEVVFLLCFERDQECCHRAQVIDAVYGARLPATALAPA